MNRGSTIFYISIALILLLPNTFGRFVFNLAGSLLLLSIIIPLIVASIGWIGWKVIQSKGNKCNSCGTTFFTDSKTCPLCGSQNIKQKSISNNIDLPASNATIDIEAKEKID